MNLPLRLSLLSPVALVLALAQDLVRGVVVTTSPGLALALALALALVLDLALGLVRVVFAIGLGLALALALGVGVLGALRGALDSRLSHLNRIKLGLAPEGVARLCPS